LLDHTLLALRRMGQHSAKFPWRGELRVWNAGDIAFGIHIEFDRPGFRATIPFFITAEKQQLEFIPPRPDRVQLLQPEADGVNQVVTGRTTRIGNVLTHPFAVRLRFRFGYLRQIRVYSWRWLGDVLAEELLADEETSRRGRSIVGFCGQGQEESLTKQASAF